MKTIGKYQIAGEMGRSAAGVTCHARDPFRDREYVLKILSPLAALSAAFKNQLYRDLAASWELEHLHIAKVQDIGELESIVYLATELLPGRALGSFLSVEASSIPERLTLIAQVAEALAYAHAHGVAHGDIKPNNIFITDLGKAAVLDFGTGSWQALLLASGVRLNGLLPNYLAPEQILGEPFNASSDIFSTGVVLYETLTGEYPFQAAPGVIPREIVHAQPKPLREWNAQIPEDLEQVVFRALHKDPRERFQTAGEFAAHLYTIADRVRREPPAPPVDVRPTLASDNVPEELAPAETAAVIPDGAAASKREEPALVAETVVEPEAVQSAPLVEAVPPPIVDRVPAPAAVAPPPVTPIPPPSPAVPARAAIPVIPVVPQAPPPPPIPRKRRLVTFAMGAVMALAMVGVIVVRQNSAAPGRQPTAQKPAPHQIDVAPEPAKPTPFAAPPTAPQATAVETPAQPTAEQILRGSVRRLWEAGEYSQAMRLVDQVLATEPANAEARGWKRRIRDAQEAEAEIK
ncbi:MAG TPA: protein kinase [Bryobacteraceae bacterium]|nr:protein kinase [Bryobacteraceae bacterium]